ncbi:helix-turn-helix transcriptional regulator [Lacticaseibacillus absianus]|uniref:helix-turn-helix transcriptional regulator n=1 Tax=Lacticaseibacillus absianus TaxID=2729623 RepID=UPI0015CD5086|nr:helix-turn-helix transcriptional regulator [Lacticaseibacillus absianus]
MTQYATTSAYLEAVRATHHIRIKALCAYVGFSPRTYQRIVRGEASPTVDEFCRWLAFLHVIPSERLHEVMMGELFPITTAQNELLTQLRAPGAVAAPDAMRARIAAYAKQTEQSDFSLLDQLLDLRLSADPTRQQALAKAVITALQTRDHWSNFEIQCFLVVEPHLNWSVVSHCMDRYMCFPDAPNKVTWAPSDYFLAWAVPLQAGYVQAAARTHICENVCQALAWDQAIRRMKWDPDYDHQATSALCQRLITVFEAPEVTPTAIEAVFQPTLAAMAALTATQPLQLMDQFEALRQALLAAGDYHHDHRPRHRATPLPLPYTPAAGIGARFDQLRRAQGVSIKSLCRLAGFSRDVYRHFQDGSGSLRLAQLCRALDCIHVAFDELVTTRDLPFWSTLVASLAQALPVYAQKGELPPDFAAKSKALHEQAVAVDNPLFLTGWLVVMMSSEETLGHYDAAGPYARQLLTLLAGYEEWDTRDYYTLADAGDHADLASAQLTMRRLVNAVKKPQSMLGQTPMAIWPAYWTGLLTVGYRSMDAGAVRAVTRVIRQIGAPVRYGANTILWGIMQHYAAYIEQVLTQGRAAAAPQWTALCAQIQQITPDEGNWAMRLLDANRNTWTALLRP